jgi:hypothetical protein
MLQSREIRGPPISGEVVGEDGDEVDGCEDAERSTGSLNGRKMNDLENRFEGATMHERLSGPVSSASEDALPQDTACDSTLAIGTGMTGRRHEQDIIEKQSLLYLEPKLAKQSRGVLSMICKS